MGGKGGLGGDSRGIGGRASLASFLDPQMILNFFFTEKMNNMALLTYDKV